MSNDVITGEHELAPATIATIRRSGEVYNLDEAEADALAQTLRAFLNAKVSLQVSLRPGFRPSYRSPIGGIAIRVGLPAEDQKEHRFGLYRFKVSPCVAKRPLAVFALCAPGSATPLALYCFKSREIASLRSLNLRFERFGRGAPRRRGECKYEFARNRWDVLG